MTIVEFDPSQFEGKDGQTKYRDWLKGLTRVQLLELEDSNLLPEEWSWEFYFEERDSRSWPIDNGLREDYLKKAFKEFAWGTKKAERTFEAILERLEPQVVGIQKKLDRLLSLIGDAELKVTVKDALKL